MSKNKGIEKIISKIANEIDFSGVVYIHDGRNKVFDFANGYSNRSDLIENRVDTKFGIASGCKLFTAIGICQLVQEGKLAFETKLRDCLNIDFPFFDHGITVHHLLTHTSGIPDYFDEAVMDDFGDLWKEKPMYHMQKLSDFLPFFQNQPMMFPPGERFHYNNAGFILLGLIIEQATGESFASYIEDHLFKPSNMLDSGYFSLDQLPPNTAVGYIDNEDGTWKSNIYSIPIKGGADGGAFTIAADMAKLWRALLHHQLLSEEITKQLLTPHIQVKEEAYYGYGVWIRKRNGHVFKYHVMGYDPGVSFASSFYPKSGIYIVIPSNKESGPHDITAAIEKDLLD